MKTSALKLILLSLAGSVCLQAADATKPLKIVEKALPYTLTFQKQPDQPIEKFPALQGYSFVPLEDGTWIILGGRTQGLHTFKTTGSNMPPSKANRFLWWINPNDQSVKLSLDLSLLPPEVGWPLMSSNQQSFYDSSSGFWYIIGGYGYDGTSQKMRTFPTFIRIPIKALVPLLQNAADDNQRISLIKDSIKVLTDDVFAVTGGALKKLGSEYLLIFGQRFDGEYNPFGGEGFVQKYTEAITFFSLKADEFKLSSSPGKLVNNDTDRPYHRRDLPVVYSVDPASGVDRVTAFGGVFKPGKIAGYLYPVIIQSRDNELRASSDSKVVQRFSQYECPTIVVHDLEAKAVYHTFFGGISHFYFHQNPAHSNMYQTVTAQGRNDGFPFVEDISTFVQRADGTYSEFISPEPIPDSQLNGSSIELIPAVHLTSSQVTTTGVLKLQGFPKDRKTLVGWIYGGINADNPLPQVPNSGTQATNVLYKVLLEPTPSPGIPAEEGKEAKGFYTHQGN